MVKSKDLYKYLHQTLGNDLKIIGFNKGKTSQLSYQKLVNGKYIIVWFQCDKWGVDKYSGSSFCINIQKSVSNELAMDVRIYKESIYERISTYLNEEELNNILLKQNIIINTLPKPPKDIYDILRNELAKNEFDKELIKSFVSPRDQIVEPYTNISDIWFRYFTPDDVTGWAEYLKKPIIRTLQKLENGC
jgi:hypothetical protein